MARTTATAKISTGARAPQLPPPSLDISVQASDKRRQPARRAPPPPTRQWNILESEEEDNVDLGSDLRGGLVKKRNVSISCLIPSVSNFNAKPS